MLDQIEEAYNNTPHRGLGYKIPNDIHLLTDVDEIKEQEKTQLLQKLKNYGATVGAIAGGGLVFWPGKIQFLRYFHENL